jgi:hypothetical protein
MAELMLVCMYECVRTHTYTHILAYVPIQHTCILGDVKKLSFVFGRIYRICSFENAPINEVTLKILVMKYTYQMNSLLELTIGVFNKNDFLAECHLLSTSLQ